MAKDDKDVVPHIRDEPRPDYLSKPPAREKLNPKLQHIVDQDDSLLESIYDGQAPDSTESSVRYAAYATRIRTILLSAHRYVAYTSDVGESFRPVAHPYLVKGAYAVSWAYLIGDVSHEGYKAYLRNQAVLNPATEPTNPVPIDGTKAIDTTTPNIVKPTLKIDTIDDYRTVMAQRAIFQGVASMGLPAFTIHSIVRYSGQALKNAKNTTLRSYGPIGLGLAAVPFLPFVFDKPVEHAVDTAFEYAFPRKYNKPEESKKEL